MALGTLVFRARRHVALAEDRSDGVIVQGELPWHASGSAADIAALCAALGPMAELIHERHAVLSFGNAVGRFRVGTLGTLVVRCGKLDEAKFDDMLADLTSVCIGLPFSAVETSALPFDRSLSDLEPVLLHAFLYARHALLGPGDGARGPLIGDLEAIVREPHRRFVVDRTSTLLPRVRRVDARTIDRLVSGLAPMQRVAANARPTRLVSALRGHLPLAVDVPLAFHTADTVENRFVRSFLDQLLALIDHTEAVADTRTTLFWRRVRHDSQAMRRALLPFSEHDLWDEVGQMRQVPVGSSVLQRRRGYRGALKHWLGLRGATRLPLDKKQSTQLLGAKDVATLYELWCFFAVVRAVETVVGSRPLSAEIVRATEREQNVPWNAQVRFGEVTVSYNLCFSPVRRGALHSSSNRFRPDVVVHVHREGQADQLHVLDAKLRVAISSPEEPAPEDDDGIEQAHEAAEGARRARQDDIVKMHAYRDALASVRSAFVLYPGNTLIAFPSAEGNPALDGVGAIPLTPGAGDLELRQHLRRILDRRTEGVVAE